MNRALAILMFPALLILGCNQPFEPNGPVNNTLVVYGILNCTSDTQYVRISTTFGSPPEPKVRNATVTLTGGGNVISFRDTTVLWLDTAGNLAPTNVYVAYKAPVQGNVIYQLEVSTPSGLTASSSITALTQPSFSRNQAGTKGYFVFTRRFKTLGGAAIVRFYVDYYVLVNNGWELHTEEVPSRRYVDAGGNDAFEYPSFVPIGTLATGNPDVLIDSTLYQLIRVRVFNKHQTNPIVFLDIRFVLTQIDDALYDYYYIKNGPVDNSLIRLDVPDFTNIRGGFGVFGSRAETIIKYRVGD
jgi:hypothetical protein